MTMMITTVGGLLDANNLYCSAAYARRRFVPWKDAKILPTSAEVSPTLATLNPRLPPGSPKFGSSVNLVRAFHARMRRRCHSVVLNLHAMVGDALSLVDDCKLGNASSACHLDLIIENMIRSSLFVCFGRKGVD